MYICLRAIWLVLCIGIGLRQAQTLHLANVAALAKVAVLFVLVASRPSNHTTCRCHRRPVVLLLCSALATSPPAAKTCGSARVCARRRVVSFIIQFNKKRAIIVFASYNIHMHMHASESALLHECMAVAQNAAQLVGSSQQSVSVSSW